MHQPLDADHARHDNTLIAAHAAGDLPDTDRPRVDALLTSCTTCADLRRDLVAIALATRDVPAPYALKRDFQLDDAQAARLRRGSWLRTVLAPFGASRSAVRPVAAAFTSIGVAGLLVATMLPGAFLASVPGQARDQGVGGLPAATDATEFQAAESGPPDRVGQEGTGGPLAPAASDDSKADPGSSDGNVQVAAGGPTTDTGNPGSVTNPSPMIAPPVVSPLVAGSVGLLALGLILFGLRLAARRLR